MKVALCFAALLADVFAAPCSYKAWNGVTYDVSALSNMTLKWTGQDNPANGFATFRVGICEKLGQCSSMGGGFQEGAVCQDDMHSDLTYCAAGYSSTPQFVDVKDVAEDVCFGMRFPDGEHRDCDVPRASYVNFQCDESQEGKVTSVVENSFDRCHYHITVASKHACPCKSRPPSPSPKPSPSPPPVYHKPYIRVGHAIPSSEKVSITIVQGKNTKTWDGYSFRQFSGWDHDFEMGNGTVIINSFTNGKAGATLLKREIFLTPGPLVVLIHGFWPPSVESQIQPIAASYTPEPSNSRVRVANLVPSEGLPTNIQLAAEGAKFPHKVLKAVNFPDASTYALIPAEELTFTVSLTYPSVTLQTLKANAPADSAFSLFMLGMINSTQYPVKATLLTDAPLASAGKATFRPRA